jgi:hypothetical protein
MTFSLSSRRLMTLGGALLFAVQFLTSASLAEDLRKKNPTSKFFVTDLEGQSQVNTGERIEELTKKSVYSAEGTIVETKPNATNAMVYSNGTGIFFDHDTRLEVRRFVQEPFTPNRTDMEVEPSISQTQSFLARGVVGLCTSKLVAGSSMSYRTPYASVAVRGRKVVIETNDKFTKVSLLEGDVTVRGGEYDAGGQTLQPGQQAIIAPGQLGTPNSITIQSIPDGELRALEDKVTVACMAKNTVYFEVADRNTNGGGKTAFDSLEQEIVPVVVVPANLPAPFVASPARIGNR